MSEESTPLTLADITPDWFRNIGMSHGVTPIKTTTSRGKRGGKGREPYDPSVLREGQLRTLAALLEVEATSGSAAITATQIARVAKISEQTVNQGMGSIRQEGREKHDNTYGYQSLLSRGLVIQVDAEREHLYYLSTVGQRRVDDLEDQILKVKAKKPYIGRPSKKTEKKPTKTKRLGKRIKENVEKVTLTSQES